MSSATLVRWAAAGLFFADNTSPAAALEVVETIARQGRSRGRLTRAKSGFVWSLPFDELQDVGRAFARAALELLIARSARVQRRELRVALPRSFQGRTQEVVLGRQLRHTEPDGALSDAAQPENRGVLNQTPGLLGQGLRLKALAEMAERTTSNGYLFGQFGRP